MAYDAASSEGREVADAVMRIQSQMQNQRANWESLWASIARYVSPREDVFQRRPSQGEVRGEYVFDTTPGLALDRGSSATHSALMPSTSMWHGLKVDDPQLDEQDEVREWCEAATHILFAARYAPKSNFSANTFEAVHSILGFGTGVLYIDENMGQHLRYRSMPLDEIYLDVNHQRQIDRVHRKFMLTARQALQLFGERAPEPARRAVEQNKGHQEFEFVHCTYTNSEVDPRRADAAGMALKSLYVWTGKGEVVMEGGYRSMPYAVGRYMPGPGEVYGRSPALTVLRDILSLNQMNKEVLQAAAMRNRPPLLAADVDVFAGNISLQPNAINYGGMSAEGRPLIQPMNPAGDPGITLELIKDKRTAINDAFFVTLFQVMVEGGNMTATEVMQRAQEKGQLLAPHMSRIQGEMLTPLIARELDILEMAGQLPPMPDILREAGGELSIEYRAPINRLQRADEAVGILRTIEALTGPGQIDPSVYDALDMDEAAKVLAMANGAPAIVLRSPDQIAQMRAQREEQQQAQSMIEAAPAISRSAREMAQAQAVFGNSPQAIPFVQPEGGQSGWDSTS